MKTIEVEYGLSDRVTFKDYPDVTGTVICIYISWSGITYQVMEKDGTMTTAVGEELEPFNKS